MKKQNLSLKFLSSALLLIVFAHTSIADVAKENDLQITKNAVETGNGQVIPAGAFGIVEIARPRQGTLLDLRGMAGRGDVILRSDEMGYCQSFPLRFVAGDFGGDTISVHTVAPVKFVIKSRRVAKALANGIDVVSEDFKVSSLDHPDADIIIMAGLGEDFGFVFNPGRNLWAELWGVKVTRVNCSPVI